MHPERPSEQVGARCGGDDRVARGGADPFADPVHGDDRCQCREALQWDEQGLAAGRESVADEGHPFGPVGSVGQPAAQKANEGTDSLIEAVDEPVREGGQAEHGGDVERENRREGLRGDVGQHADQAHEHDGGPDSTVGSPPDAGLDVGAETIRQVHRHPHLLAGAVRCGRRSQDRKTQPRFVAVSPGPAHRGPPRSAPPTADRRPRVTDHARGLPVRDTERRRQGRRRGASGARTGTRGARFSILRT